jgi:tRNA(Ile)-lysidine synthase
VRELSTVSGVAHFNHKLRGEASEDDERFVAALAAKLNLPFYRAEARLGAGNLEQAARRARHGFFAGLIQDGAADRIALGHTRDDQAETVLFRLLRGSGLAGLAGIHPVTQAGFIRPFIDITRAEVTEFLSSRGIVWREDASNREPRFARNRIRSGLLPQLEREWNPNIREALAHLADLAYEEERWLEPKGKPGGLPYHELQLTGLPRGLARRLVRRAIKQVKGDLRGIEYQHVEGVIELPRGRLELPGVEVIRSFDRIRIAVPESKVIEPIEVSVPGTYPAPDGASEIQVEVSPYANLKVELAWGKIPEPLQLRGWRPGDHYQPVGHSRDLKVKELFQKARVPSWHRRFWPMLTGGGKILWARGFGAAEEYAATEGTGPVLRIVEVETTSAGPFRDLAASYPVGREM